MALLQPELVLVLPQRQYAAFVPQIECRFRLSRLSTYFLTDWHREHDVPYVGANLVAIKDGARQGGFLLI